MLNYDENRLLEMLESSGSSRITFDIVKLSSRSDHRCESESKLYENFINNLHQSPDLANAEIADDDSDSFQDGKTPAEDLEIPNMVPVKEILDLFEDEYMFKLKDHGLMDRLRKRMENIQNAAE